MKKTLRLAISLCVFIFSFSVTQAANFNYKLLETFPGFFKAGDSLNDLPTLVASLYSLGIWLVGISALFMIVVGGIMYITSAGNTSRAGSAKGIIADALTGLVVALASWLFLYVINPDLVKINLSLVSVGNFSFSDTRGVGTPSSGNANSIIDAARQMMDQKCIYSQQKRNSCATNPGYTDCSNLVCTSYQKAGCKCPGTVSSQYLSIAQNIGDKSSLSSGDVLSVPGHVVMCVDNGCSKVIGAAGVGKDIKYSNSDYYITKMGAKVVRAADYCKN